MTIMCIILITTVSDGVVGEPEKRRLANYAKAKELAESLVGAGRIVCIKRSGKVLFVG